MVRTLGIVYDMFMYPFVMIRLFKEFVKTMIGIKIESDFSQDTSMMVLEYGDGGEIRRLKRDKSTRTAGSLARFMKRAITTKRNLSTRRLGRRRRSSITFDSNNKMELKFSNSCDLSKRDLQMAAVYSHIDN